MRSHKNVRLFAYPKQIKRTMTLEELHYITSADENVCGADENVRGE